jgi:16S rRNA (adenine1518-N6/adenine1519-N6)-dimethyltransferase
MVKPKKHLGQHFLLDENISANIASGLTGYGGYKRVLEIGPGTGALTTYLVQKDWDLFLLEIDTESIFYLHNNYPNLSENIIAGDFLKLDVEKIIKPPFALIGNFPYNISSQIMFRVLEMRDAIPEVVGMFQKEVAERLVAPPGTKKTGILSVLLQTWYDCEYLFTVDKEAFNPPPKVQSGVIRLKRNKRVKLEVDEGDFKRIIKLAFNQRRKTLRNSLKSVLIEKGIDTSDPFFTKRPEQLSVEEFIGLTKLLVSNPD